jgi:signal peptidase II
LVKKVILIIFLILMFDQVVKIWVRTSMVPTTGQIVFHQIKPTDEGLVTYNPDDKPDEIKLIPGFFEMTYTENQGMAFGTKISNAKWGKLFLSIFRMLAIGGIGYYLYTIIRDKRKFGFILAISLIFAGAFGNLIDSMFYDFIFQIEPHYSFNYTCNNFDESCHRPTGFLFGNVVDMFHFTVEWPSGWPSWLRIGGSDRVFPAIFNIADVSITAGVILIVFKQRSFFGKKKKDIDHQEVEPTEA